jgi:hypothetical protein
MSSSVDARGLAAWIVAIATCLPDDALRLYEVGAMSPARLRSQNPALRYVAKPTHSA